VRLLPLRERLEDIGPLAEAFFIRHGYARTALTERALEQLKGCSWRGNVRELFNVLERAAIVAQGGAIEPEHLLLEDETNQWSGALGAVNHNGNGEIPAMRGATPPLTAGEQVSVREMEEQLIFKTLKEVNDNRTQAAKRLGISVRTLRNKLKQYRERAYREEA
jgi:two-component system response regulator FlrC